MWGPRTINFGDNNVALTDWFPFNQHGRRTFLPVFFNFDSFSSPFFILFENTNEPSLPFYKKNCISRTNRKLPFFPSLYFHQRLNWKLKNDFNKIGSVTLYVLKNFLFPNCSMKSSEKIIFPFCPTMEKKLLFFFLKLLLFFKILFSRILPFSFGEGITKTLFYPTLLNFLEIILRKFM